MFGRLTLPLNKWLLFSLPLSQAEIQEANLDSSNVCMASLEREVRFLAKEVEGLRETAERVKGLEGDNRELTKQAAIDQRTLATLREVLTEEIIILTHFTDNATAAACMCFTEALRFYIR